VRPKNKDLAVGYFFYLRSHRDGHKLMPQALGPFEYLDTNGTYFAIDQGDGEGRINGKDVTPAPRPMSGPDSQPHRLTQAPLPDVNSSDEDPTKEIDRLLAIRHDADNSIVEKVRWATYGRGGDSWEPISGLPKHLVIRMAKQKTLTLPDDAFPTTPVVLAPCPRQPDWVCVAVQQDTDGRGAVLVDVRWTLWYHSQADPTRAAFPTGHPVVSSMTPEVSANTHTHNWFGRQRQAANTTQRFEAQRLLASLGGFGTALLSRSDIPTCPLPQSSGGPSKVGQKQGSNAGHTLRRGCAQDAIKTREQKPRGEGEMH